MKKQILKILKFFLIGVSIYVVILVIEFCCIYAVKGENTWDYLKDFWEWYSTMFF